MQSNKFYELIFRLYNIEKEKNILEIEIIYRIVE